MSGAASIRPTPDSDPDAVVVGSGPNGLAAALTLALAGVSVRVIEGEDEVGGGCRSSALTLPGFVHDICAAVHPLVAASPFFARFDLGRAGIELAFSEAEFAHPIDGGRAAAVFQSVDETADALGRDGSTYRRIMHPLVEHADGIVAQVLSPMRAVPRDRLGFARYGLVAPLPASVLVRRLQTPEAGSLLAGLASHAMRPLSAPITGGFALVLGVLAHAARWPVVCGGSGKLAHALADAVRAAGGEVITGWRVRSLDELGNPRAVLLDVAPAHLLEIAGPRLPARYARALRRFRYGPGVCKVDYALSGPVPWSAAVCHRATTVHVGGRFEEVAAAEAEVAAGRHPGRPFVLVAQPCVADPDRAPGDATTLWAYCHVPNGSDLDVSDSIETQIERFAPGWRDLVIERRVRTARDVEAHNPNYVGGDIQAGAATLRQILLRPVAAWNPYKTPLRGVYLCSSSTPPGGGVHGMCGENAATMALRQIFGKGRHS
jgi:phytoene dehydrogenase-like protein